MGLRDLYWPVWSVAGCELRIESAESVSLCAMLYAERSDRGFSTLSTLAHFRHFSSLALTTDYGDGVWIVAPGWTAFSVLVINAVAVVSSV